MTVSDYQKIENRFVRWGLTDNEALAAIVVGSRAILRPPDEHADLDLILFTREPSRLIQSSEWFFPIAIPWIANMSFTGKSDPEWMLIFNNGAKVDLVIRESAPDNSLADLLENLPYQEVLNRGYRILFDKTGSHISNKHQQPLSLQPPAFKDFDTLINQALITIYRSTKYTRRGDIWRAQVELGLIRQALLRLFEWHTIITSKEDVDVWYGGRFLDDWVDSRINNKISQLFPTHDIVSLLRALATALSILQLTSGEIAVGSGFPFPSSGQSDFIDWLRHYIRHSTNSE